MYRSGRSCPGGTRVQCMVPFPDIAEEYNMKGCSVMRRWDKRGPGLRHEIRHRNPNVSLQRLKLPVPHQFVGAREVSGKVNECSNTDNLFCFASHLLLGRVAVMFFSVAAASLRQQEQDELFHGILTGLVLIGRGT